MTNLVSNPRIRALVFCGKDSPVFHAAQGIRALVKNGVTAERRIIGARGHWPVLRNLSGEQIERFRRQVMLVEAIGTSELSAIGRQVADAATRVAGLSAKAGPTPQPLESPRPTFKRLAAGGHREPIGYDPRGFFIIILDSDAREIVCQHYSVDHAPAHEIRSHSAERILLGLLRADLVSRLSHAGYLGAELVKAETALRLGLRYEQDKALGAPGPAEAIDGNGTA